MGRTAASMRLHAAEKGLLRGYKRLQSDLQSSRPLHKSCVFQLQSRHRLDSRDLHPSWHAYMMSAARSMGQQPCPCAWHGPVLNNKTHSNSM